MREIKARVWLDGKMWHHDTIVDSGDTQRNLIITMDGEVRICDWRDGKVGMQSPAFFHLEATILQYTERKDRNGKEIYHGDILKKGNRKYKVVCRDGCFEIYMPHYGYRYLRECEFFEVIGNIYENPELIKST